MGMTGIEKRVDRQARRYVTGEPPAKFILIWKPDCSSSLDHADERMCSRLMDTTTQVSARLKRIDGFE